MTSLCLPEDKGLISIYLQLRDNSYNSYIVATSFLEQHREGGRLEGILFQICYEYKVRRLNNILIIGNARDTDIRQCIHRQILFIVLITIYSVYRPYRIGLIMRCYLFLSACEMAWVWAKYKIRNPVTVTP